jgi:exodeoxyribonuclease VII large subunit
MSTRPFRDDDPFAWEPRVPAGDAPPPTPPPLPVPETAHLYQVSELTRAIRGRLEDLGRVAVEGEVTRIVQANSGHVYFDLKDIDAKLSCTIWRSQVGAAVRFKLDEGMKVIAHGKLDVYAPRGTYSLNVSRLEPAGLGALLVQLEELKAKLKAQGWFERRRALPPMPRVIGIATSRDGAAFQDFLRTRSMRWPLYPVRLAHTLVQGPSAAREIAAAIARLDASGVDVIVVCRGGGSLEDLWAFNEMAVLEAIRNASVPVVSGIGHETDVTVSDLVADRRAHTPTDAAQTVIPDRAQLCEKLERARNQLLQAADAVLDARVRRLERIEASAALRDPATILARRRDRLEGAGRALRGTLDTHVARSRTRVERAATRLARQAPGLVLARATARVESAGPRLRSAALARVEARIRRLELCERSLAATSPLAVLGRGYSITRRVAGGAPLVDAALVQKGEVIETLLSSGSLISSVSDAKPARPHRS